MRLDFPIVSDKVLPITDKAFNLQVPHTDLDPSMYSLELLLDHALKLARKKKFMKTRGREAPNFDRRLVGESRDLFNMVRNMFSGTVWIIGSTKSELIRLGELVDGRVQCVQAISEGGPNLGNFEAYLNRAKEGDALWFFNMHGLSPYFFSELKEACGQRGVGLCVRMSTKGDVVPLNKTKRIREVGAWMYDRVQMTQGVNGVYVSAWYNWRAIFADWTMRGDHYEGCYGVFSPYDHGIHPLFIRNMRSGGEFPSGMVKDEIVLSKVAWRYFGTTRCHTSPRVGFLKRLTSTSLREGVLVLAHMEDGVQPHAMYIPGSGCLFMYRFRSTEPTLCYRVARDARGS
jgi:hypothetical protein